jgi:hypothetical protein
MSDRGSVFLGHFRVGAWAFGGVRRLRVTPRKAASLLVLQQKTGMRAAVIELYPDAAAGLIAERCQNIGFFGGRKGTGKLDRGDYLSAHISADFALDYRARR